MNFKYRGLLSNYNVMMQLKAKKRFFSRLNRNNKYFKYNGNVIIKKGNK